jgi:hypothetical protein
MTEDYERTYLEIWGELPPRSDAEPSRPEVSAELLDPPTAPELNGSPRQPVQVGPPDPSSEIDRKANEVIQRMMVDTLRRIEGRLAVMDDRSRANSSPDAVEALCEQLTKMSEEVGQFLERTRKVNEQLAGLQLESARNLQILAQKVKEMQSRPLHWPPH